jgi:hypothetical protein
MGKFLGGTESKQIKNEYEQRFDNILDAFAANIVNRKEPKYRFFPVFYLIISLTIKAIISYHL